MSKFKYQIVSVQIWNNNNRQLLTQHKTLKAAQKQLASDNKTAARMQNKYHIEEITN